MNARKLAAELCVAVHKDVPGSSTSLVQDTERGLYAGQEACFDVEWFDPNDELSGRGGMTAAQFLVTVKQIA